MKKSAILAFQLFALLSSLLVFNSCDGANDSRFNDFHEHDYPVSSSVHDFYINYYQDIGLGTQLANDFYFFSINAATANNIHFMNENELQFYQIFTE